ncbi:ABC transporter permease [Sanguibacter antarcticus]|uniref:Putative ABC transport system permease protein n=1 Tax=Sanguibacter antarcticus TaxID=372484 RepID=A0A2A9EAI1_9MICO|nr:ABC transporter permease [Sanguibacter antarcticus]PFG35220.1 putative ABC transport system permease protein [Sanguibacter antarcticus]
MLRVALRNVRAHLVRLGLSILAVVLGVSFVAGTFALRDMLSSTFNGIVEAGYSADVYLRGPDDPDQASQSSAGTRTVRNLVPADLVSTVTGVDGVAQAFADFTGPITLVGADGTAVTSGAGAPSFAVGFHSDDPSITLAEGSGPTDATEFALEVTSAEASGLSIGDTTTLIVGGELTQATLTGVVDLETSLAGATVVFLDAGTAESVYAPDGRVATISVFAADGVDPDDLVTDIDTAISGVATAGSVQTVTGDVVRDEARDDIDGILGFVETFLLIFAGISLFVGGFIIANTFAMTVRQRQREFALLRAVGASPFQVFASILIQAAVVGLLGGVLGIAGGLGLVTGIKALFARMGMDLSGEIPLTTTMVVLSLLVGLVVSVASAALPARRAALVPPVEAMRDESPGQGKSLVVRGLVGLVIAVAGAAAVVMAVVQAAADEDAGTGRLLGIGAVGVVIGVLLLAPVMARAVLGVLAAPFVVLVRPLGKLARGNVTRNPRRTASTASALMIGMALVGAASVLATSTQASVRTVVENEWKADLMVQSATFFLPAAAVDEISALPEVASADALAIGTAAVSDGTTPDGGGGGETVSLIGMPADTFGRSWTTEEVSGDIGSMLDGALAVNKDSATDAGWTVGDELTLTTSSGTLTAPVGAIIDSTALDAPVVVPLDLFETIQPQVAEQVQTLLLKRADGVDEADLRAAVTATAKPYVVLSVLDDEQFITQLAGQVTMILNILYALLGLSIIIAILGIVNTLALSVIERTREIGLMRAVGLGRAQLAGTITIESILTALFGTVVGLAVGVALAAGLPTVFAGSGLTELAIPWRELLTMLVIAVVVGIFAAVWPAIRAARLPVLEAVTVD